MRIDTEARRVTFSVAEVEDFASRWPGFASTGRPVTFAFDAHGNLEDLEGEPEGDHDARAVLALSEEAADVLDMLGCFPLPYPRTLEQKD